MAKEWIQKLAGGIKDKDHDTAEATLKQEHRQRVLAAKGEQFYDLLIKGLQEDITELTAALAGDSTASPITLNIAGAQRSYTIKKERFPVVNASLQYGINQIRFKFKPQAKGATPSVDQTETLNFHLAENEGLSLRQAFGEETRHFNQPDELAKYIMEKLFTV